MLVCERQARQTKKIGSDEILQLLTEKIKLITCAYTLDIVQLKCAKKILHTPKSTSNDLKKVDHSQQKLGQSNELKRF